MPTTRTLHVLLIVALGASCAPTLHVISYQPGAIEPHGARRMVIVDGEGKRAARDLVAGLLADELHSSWYRAKDRSDEGIKLVLAGRRATIAPEDARGIGEDDMWLRADVIDWDLVSTEIDTGDDDDNGEPILAAGVRAEVGLQITITDDEGRVLMREAEYIGVAEAQAGPFLDPNDVMAAAARTAVREFVARVEPQRVGQSVRIDDSDPGQDAIVEGIKGGSFGGARKALERYLKRHPKNAIAHYNLAVVLDAQGNFARALKEYDKAIDLQPRDYYFASREGCARRVAAHQALYGEPARKKARRADDDAPASNDKRGDAPPPPPG